MGDGQGLFAGPEDGGVLEGLFGSEAFLVVVGLVGDGDGEVNEAGGSAVLEEFPGADAGGAGAAGVVGEPESVSG
jgi:hypothetical protein